MPNKKKDKKKDSSLSESKAKLPLLPINLDISTALNKLSPIIVCIGASAGGLEALKVFFKNAREKVTNMAFIIVSHFNPNQVTLLPELVQRYTSMKVALIEDKTIVESNHVYILSPGNNVFIRKGVLHLLAQKKGAGLRLPIDYFLRSLAIDKTEKAMCIILSGTGGDGTVGLRAIRDNNGLIIVQTPKSARYDGMPKSAISTGFVDYILPPEEMFEFLVKYLAHVKDNTVTIESSISEEIKQVLVLLYNQTGQDFSSYKVNTIFRRIQKRMNILQLESLSVYTHYLRQNPHEIEILFSELLINVTNFFRDPEAFEALKKVLMENVLKGKPKDYCVRIWIPGCATGEEAYSIAIILQECMDTLKRRFSVQIFGTDIDSDVIDKARSGIFPANIALDISPERLSRFFVKEENNYKINLDTRKMIIFAVQNTIKDPPFTKLDLLSCRNLLIYFNSQLQKKVLPLFHYSLKPGGLLFLGTSESISGTVDLFNPVDRKWKIFEKKHTGAAFQSVMDFPSTPRMPEPYIKNMENNMQSNEKKLAPIVENLLLEDYAPPCVIIDEKENVIYVYGRTGKFIELASGEARLQIMNMVRVELKSKLATAIRQAITQQKEITFQKLQIKDGKEFKYINLKVRPFSHAEVDNRKLLLVIFEDVLPVEHEVQSEGKQYAKSTLEKRISEMEQELKHTKENLQTTIEELETSNEELKSSNEELQSTNEELQSTNEEIETSKEELQSLNEELTTVNAELESRVEQLSSANDDIKNLLDNTEIATVFLDKDLCVKRFTPKAMEIINLIPSDVGRPISHIVSNLQYEKLLDDARFVLRTLESKTTQVVDKNGHWHVVRVIPYRTVTNIIDGVVVTFINIHVQKQAEDELAMLQQTLKVEHEIKYALFNSASDAMMLLDDSGKVISINQAFSKMFKIKNENIASHCLSKTSLGWDVKELKILLDDVLLKNAEIIDYKINGASGKQISLSLHKIFPTIILLKVNNTI